MKLKQRQIMIWGIFLVLIGLIIGLDYFNSGQSKPRVDSHGHIISETVMLLPLPIEQITTIEIGYQGELYRFERNHAGAWFYHTHDHEHEHDHQHAHHSNLIHSELIEKAFAAFGRTRIERQFTLNKHMPEYGVTKPNIVIMLYRHGQLKPEARYAVGAIAPDKLSRYLMITGSFRIVTIPNYQIENLLNLLDIIKKA